MNNFEDEQVDKQNGEENLNGINTLHAITAVSFISLLLIVGIFAIFSPKSGVSVIEKRELAKLPPFSVSAYFEGDYTGKLSLYFADNFPLRDMLVGLASNIKESYGLRPDNVRIYVPDQNPDQETEKGEDLNPPPVVNGSSEVSSHIEPPTPPITQPAKPSDQKGVQIGGLFVYEGRALQIFGGNSAVGARYAAAINGYHKLLGDGVQIYNLVIPSAIEFALPPKYKSITSPERPKINEIYDALDEGIKKVDIYDVISEHSDEYLYFNTDHHWTSLGAYYAYTKFAQQAGFEPVDINRMEKRVLQGFLGTLYAQTQDTKVKENIDHVDYYMIDNPHRVYQYQQHSPYYPREISLYGEYAKSPNSYSVFLHGDLPMVQIDTQLKNGRKIAVIKDSYGNAFVPFLVNHYEQVIVIDPRYFQRGFLSLVKEYGINEVLFINNSFAANTSSQVNLINNIKYNTIPAKPPEPEPEPELPLEQPVQGEGAEPPVVDPA